ncbi:MAG: hypothetical protein WCD35_08135 [Mycobacteriales bacterium]
MEDRFLEHYVREIGAQAAVARLSASALGEALAGADPAAVPVLAAAQGLVGAALQVTRLLWPHPAAVRPDGRPLSTAQERRRQWTSDRAQSLRRVVGPIDEQSSALGLRGARGALERFDEYVDAYLLGVADGTRSDVAADLEIGPRSAVAPPVVCLRHLDSGPALLLSVLDREVALHPLMEEIERVAALADAWRPAATPSC